jgi:hypothetical protein
MGKGSLNLRASTPRAQASLPTAAPSQRSPLGTRAGFDSLKAPLAGSLSRPVKTLGLSRMILGGKPRPEREGIDQDLAASKALLSPLPMRVRRLTYSSPTSLVLGYHAATWYFAATSSLTASLCCALHFRLVSSGHSTTQPSSRSTAWDAFQRL